MSYFLRESRSKRRHYPKKTFNACLLTYASGRTVCLLRRKSGESYRSFRKRYVDVVADFGGALTAKEDNLIVVAPSVGEIEVELDYFPTNTAGSLFPTQRVLQNTTSALFHEIGERNTTNTFRGSVIDYENHVRKVIGLPVRPYDVTHSYKYPLI